MKKRLISGAAALVFALSGAGLWADMGGEQVPWLSIAASAETSGYYTYSVSNGAATITKYNGSESYLTIPSTLGGAAVKTISAQAFYHIGYGQQGGSLLRSITIPDSVTTIGTEAFAGCSMVNTIKIGNGVTAVPANCFVDCPQITSVTFGNSVTSIGNYAFDGVAKGGLTWSGQLPMTVSFNNSLKTIGNYSFRSRTGISSITIPDSVTYIGSYAFQGCTSLSSLTLSSGLTYIGGSAFENTAVTSVVIPPKVTTLGTSFANCSKLKSIEIGSGVKSISATALFNCASLTDVKFSDGGVLTTINKSAFKGCSSLKKLVLPNGVTKIAATAFANCTSLTDITIPASVTSIASDIFDGCTLSKITIHGAKNSAAETFAVSNGINFIADQQSAHIHTESSSKVTKAATCKEAGEKTYYCSCGAAVRTETITKTNNHSYSEISRTNATCGKKGTIVYQCSVCGSKKSEDIAATGNHTFAETGRINATCAASGSITYTCSGCGTKKTETIAATGKHTFGSWVVTTPATTTSTGVKTRTCSVCKKTETQTIPKLTVTDTAPAAPKVTAVPGNGKITLKWDAVSGAEKYAICRYSKVNGRDNFKLFSDCYPGTSITFGGLTNGETYQYLVQAGKTGSNGKMLWSSYTTADIVTSLPNGPVTPAAPYVTAAAGDGKITLRWNAVSGADKYAVCRYENGKYILITASYTGTSLNITGLKNGTNYQYLVQAGKTLSDGSILWSKYTASDIVTAMPTGTASPKVTATAGNGTVRLTWSAVPGAEKYAICRYSAGKFILYSGTYPGTSISFGQLTNGVTYQYLVQAWVNGQWTGYSTADIVSVTPHA